MKNPDNESFSKHLSSWVEETLIKRILLTHNHENCDVDAEVLLRVIEAIMHHATKSQDTVQQDSVDVSGMDFDESQDPPGNSVHRISRKILCRAYQEETGDASTLSVLNLLGCYKWEDKMVLVLLAFATVYGKFWIIMQYRNQNSLAASIAIIQQFPNNISKFTPIFTALDALMRTMIQVIRCAAEFERLPITFVEMQDDMAIATKAPTYLATYWVVRSTVMCISLITNLRDIKDEQMSSSSTSAVVREIRSYQTKISSMVTQLKRQVDVCQQQTVQQMHQKLRSTFQETHTNNQEVLRLLFALKDDSPLKQTSEFPKLKISSLENKVVILLLSKPELLPIEDLLFLVHQMYDHPLHNKPEGMYDIVWIPISASTNWSNNEIKIFKFLSNSLPWYSIRQPWSISPTTINYAKEEWRYKGEPIMVALDSTGRVTNLDASDMVWIWGATAYPFTVTREKELWNEEEWSLKLLLGNINPLLNMWAEEGRTICLYISSNLEWVMEFCAEMKYIQSLVSHIEVIYVGKKDPSQLVTNIVSVIEKEKLSDSLSLAKTHFFWRRLDSMKRSKVRLGEPTSTDHILREIEPLLQTSEVDSDENWIIIGSGFSTNMIKLQANDWIKFLGHYQIWEKYLPKIGLVDAIRHFLDPPPREQCLDPKIVSYSEGPMEEKVICEKCKHPMEKLIMYDAVE